MPAAVPPFTHIIHCTRNAATVEQTLRSQGIDCALIRSAHDCQLAPACHWLKEAPLNPQARLAAAIDETIAVLNNTRHAFKSKELATLRRGLERLLSEVSPTKTACPSTT